jgi:hypothetical protein
MNDTLATGRIASATGGTPRLTRSRRISIALSALAVVGMGTATVACSPRNEKPAETSVNTPAPSATPTEKGMRTNVTRSPMAAVPPGGAGGNGAVPCGFGPAGGGPCGNNG